MRPLFDGRYRFAVGQRESFLPRKLDAETQTFLREFEAGLFWFPKARQLGKMRRNERDCPEGRFGHERGQTRPTGGRHLGLDCRLGENGTGFQFTARGVGLAGHGSSASPGQWNRRGEFETPSWPIEMNWRVIFKPAAAVEMEQAPARHEQREAGWGDEFLRCAAAGFASPPCNPEA